jgi:hypothetical protein
MFTLSSYIRHGSWSKRLLRLMEWTVGLIRTSIFPYVSCFINALDNKDPEFPVALAFKDKDGGNEFHDLWKATLLR